MFNIFQKKEKNGTGKSAAAVSCRTGNAGRPLYSNYDPDTAYGVLSYAAVNIGDDVQSVAAMRFLPKIDYYIPREQVRSFKSKNGEKAKLIMNAWWMHHPDHFPPSEDIDPLFVSFHLTERIRDRFFRDDVTAYLKAHQPIGCRDTSTVQALQNAGIDAYFTGCLTTTFLPNPALKGKFISGYILCVDCPEDVVNTVKKQAGKPVYSITRMLSPAFTSINRFELSKYILFLYHNADLVITPRLHVGLPATAFETPCCMLKGKNLKREGRFDGLEVLFNEIDADEYVKDPGIYDVNKPPANPENYKPMAKNLVKAVTAFTGYDSGASPFADDYNPMISIIKLLAYDPKITERMLMFAKPDQLRTALDNRTVKKQDKYDLTF